MRMKILLIGLVVATFVQEARTALRLHRRAEPGTLDETIDKVSKAIDAATKREPEEPDLDKSIDDTSKSIDESPERARDGLHEAGNEAKEVEQEARDARDKASQKTDKSIDETSETLDETGKGVKHHAKDAKSTAEQEVNQEVEHVEHDANQVKKTAEPAVQGDLDKSIDAASETVDAAGKRTIEDNKDMLRDAGRGPASYADGAKKPAMDSIEVMRTMMCWARPHLIHHEDCMEFMVEKCKEETTGQGFCTKFRKYIKSQCRHGVEKGCDYMKEMDIEMDKHEETTEEAKDLDGDGVKDEDDAFPDNPLEWKDTDGDGYGDNFDKWPKDPLRPAHPGPVPSPAAAPGPAPAPAAPAGPASPAPTPPPPAPTGLSMKVTDKGLPEQGFSGHSDKHVLHEDGITMTKDWRLEWPMMDRTEDESVHDICDDYPNHAWCKLKKSKAARRAYAISHP